MRYGDKYKEIKAIFAQKAISTQNMLQISQYNMIGSSKVRELIMGRDIQKYNLRKAAKNRGAKKGAWDKELN
jgi:hypothetical protein